MRLGVTWTSTLSPSIIVWWRTFSRKDLKCAATEGTEKHHRLPHAGDMALCALLTSEATFSCSLFTVRHHSGQLSMFDLADFYSGCPSWHNPKWNFCLQLEVSQWSLPSKCVNHDAVEAHTFWTSESENKGAGSQFKHTGRDWACILEAQPKRPLLEHFDHTVMEVKTGALLCSTNDNLFSTTDNTIEDKYVIRTNYSLHINHWKKNHVLSPRSKNNDLRCSSLYFRYREQLCASDWLRCALVQTEHMIVRAQMRRLSFEEVLAAVIVTGRQNKGIIKKYRVLKS